MTGLVAAMGIVMSTGCSIDPAQVPVPGSSVGGDTYRLNIEFANALNLPARARVIANGVRIGTLEHVTIIDGADGAPGHINALVEIKRSVRLPVSTTAQLRQKTLLGDMYIGLDVSARGSTGVLADGGVIPLDQTKPAMQVEDLMAGMATFVTSGAIGDLERMISRTNAIMPRITSDTAAMFGAVGTDLKNLAGYTSALDRFMDATNRDLKAVLDSRPVLESMLSPDGVKVVLSNFTTLTGAFNVIGGFGDLADGMMWMAPFLAQTERAVAVLVPLLLGNRPMDLTSPSNLNRFVALMNQKVIPFIDGGARIDITAIEVNPKPSGVAAQKVDVSAMADVLRMIGLVR
jgi:hypothetical protein